MNDAPTYTFDHRPGHKAASPAHPPDPAGAVIARSETTDRTIRWLTQSAAILVLVVLSAVIASLIAGAWPALRVFGFGFLASESWNPVTDTYGAFAPIIGTLVTSFLAMIVAVPLSILIATFLTELCPTAYRRPIGMAIELLAGIPSIIYGIWGLFVLAPFLQEYVQPTIISLCSGIPILRDLFAGPPYGIGVFTASIVLAGMILPFMTAVTRDVFDSVPAVLRESAYGLGCTTTEVVRHIILPYCRIGVLGGAMLALGRALGETMAVTFIIGNAHRISISLFAPGTTISATIANEFTEAVTDLYTSSLIALGLILFVITFLVFAAARLLLARLGRSVAP